MKLLSWLVPLVVVMFFSSRKGRVFATYAVAAIKDNALFGFTIANLTNTVVDVSYCLAMCLQNCRCMSFQICEDQVCQLCSTNTDVSPLAFKNAEGCTYFSFRNNLEVNEQHCQQCTREKCCFVGTSCCLTSNPCQNGGLCEPVMATDQTKHRFRCSCRPGYYGDLCQVIIKSCRGYVNGGRVARKYKVVDADMKAFDVFCDFDTNSAMAWTLIQSYQLQNDTLKLHPLTENCPVHEDTSGWSLYRLSTPRIESIQQDSSEWRMACRYNSNGVNHSEYIRALNEKSNILSYNVTQCKEVDFADVCGYNCSGCTVRLVQTTEDHSARIMHVDSYISNIDCGSTVKDSVAHEDNLGWYRTENPVHRCSSSATSTSQIWLGGN